MSHTCVPDHAGPWAVGRMLSGIDEVASSPQETAGGPGGAHQNQMHALQAQLDGAVRNLGWRHFSFCLTIVTHGPCWGLHTERETCYTISHTGRCVPIPSLSRGGDTPAAGTGSPRAFISLWRTNAVCTYTCRRQCWEWTEKPIAPTFTSARILTDSNSLWRQ